MPHRLPPTDQVLDLLPDAVCVVDADGVLRFANAAFDRLLGLRPGEMVGRALFELVHPDDRAASEYQAQALMQGGGERHFRNRYLHRDGRALELLWAAHWLPEYGVRIGVGREIGDLRRMERELEHHAHHDPLTGLANRRRLEQAVHAALGQAVERAGQVALLYIDLDGFKQVNDGGGHDAGDQVLRMLAQRLQDGVRQSDLVARIGGDEFVVLLPGCSVADAHAMAGQLRQCLRAPCTLQAATFALDASIGIACFPDDGADAATLIARADAAMYAGKRPR
ncbi:MAG: diguanylate cyclase domain-containing protein [Thermomonas sp.]